MKLTYYGHSALQLTIGDTEVLLDPFISDNPLANNVVTAEELNPDFILVTHAHGDHWGDTPEIAMRSDAVVVANFEITQYLSKKYGHNRVQPMNIGGSWTFDWGKVTQTDARHSSSFPDGTYGGNPNGYIIQAQGKTIYALGDTSLFAEMEWIGSHYSIDLALVPIGDCFTMCPETSVFAADMLKPAMTVPVHYDTFPLIEVDMAEWTGAMGAAGHLTRVMSPGETFEL